MMKKFVGIMAIGVFITGAIVAREKQLTVAKLRNATYAVDEMNVKLRNGNFELGHESYELLRESIAFTDLDGDGEKEAVAVLLNSPGVGGGEFYYLLAIRNVNGEPELLDAKRLDGRVVFPLSISNGIITIRILTIWPAEERTDKKYRFSTHNHWELVP